MYDGDINVFIEKSKKLVMIYGTLGMYFLYPDMDRYVVCNYLMRLKRDLNKIFMLLYNF